LSFEKVVTLYINIEASSRGENPNAFYSGCELDLSLTIIASIHQLLIHYFSAFALINNFFKCMKLKD